MNCRLQELTVPLGGFVRCIDVHGGPDAVDCSETYIVNAYYAECRIDVRCFLDGKLWFRLGSRPVFPHRIKLSQDGTGILVVRSDVRVLNP